VRELGALPNVTCKLSGLGTEALPDGVPPGDLQATDLRVSDLQPYVDVVLEAFGPARLMVGSDWPVCLLAASYERVLEIAGDALGGLTEAERDAVLGGTAVEVYRLTPEMLTQSASVPHSL
jgi:L-fuconolactonase